MGVKWAGLLVARLSCIQPPIPLQVDKFEGRS